WITICSERVMSCLLCRGTSDRLVWCENGYEGRACSCGTVYTSPEPAVASVDPTKDAHSDAFYSTYASLKARWVRNIPVSGRLLEIGCGEGHFLAAAKRLGFEVTGLEPNVERATRVRKRLQVDVRCSLLEDVVWPDAGFD